MGNAGSATHNSSKRRGEGSNRYVGIDPNSKVADVFKSVLEAIREGDWFYEPDEVGPGRFDATMAVPGSAEKLDVLAARARLGLPLWHVKDRADYDDPDAE